MLVLTRKANQSIMIGDQIEVSVLSVLGEKVRLGIQAPRDVPVFRKEVFLEIQAQNIQAADASREALDQALGMMGEADAVAPEQPPAAATPDEEPNDGTG
jgi:carbon storage regulator